MCRKFRVQIYHNIDGCICSHEEFTYRAGKIVEGGNAVLVICARDFFILNSQYDYFPHNVKYAQEVQKYKCENDENQGLHNTFLLVIPIDRRIT